MVTPSRDISSIARLTNLKRLYLWRNSISDISHLEGLINLEQLDLDDNSITDISPLVANTGLGSGDIVWLEGNPLISTSISTHIPALQRRGVEVLFEDLKPTTSEYTLSIPAGISLIHVPLKVTAVNRSPRTIESISELYDALGGAGTVNFLITYDSQAQEWHSYFVPSDKGGPADSGLGDDTGIIVGLKAPVSVQLTGDALGTNGNSSISLSPGSQRCGAALERFKDKPCQRSVHARRNRWQRSCDNPHRWWGVQAGRTGG